MNMHSIQYFATPEFVRSHKEQVGAYADLRLKAVQAEFAILRVFGEEYRNEDIQCRAAVLENNVAYRRVFEAKFEALDLRDMFSPQIAVRTMLSLLHDQNTGSQTKAECIKQLTAMYGITPEDVRRNGRWQVVPLTQPH